MYAKEYIINRAKKALHGGKLITDPVTSEEIVRKGGKHYYSLTETGDGGASYERHKVTMSYDPHSGKIEILEYSASLN